MVYLMHPAERESDELRYLHLEAMTDGYEDGEYDPDRCPICGSYDCTGTCILPPLLTQRGQPEIARMDADMPIYRDPDTGAELPY